MEPSQFQPLLRICIKAATEVSAQILLSRLRTAHTQQVQTSQRRVTKNAVQSALARRRRWQANANTLFTRSFFEGAMTCAAGCPSLAPVIFPVPEAGVEPPPAFGCGAERFCAPPLKWN